MKGARYGESVCGRYASARKAEDIAESFGIRPERIEGSLDADYNVAPTKPVFTVVERVPRRVDSDSGQDAAVRQLRVARWGLVPSWAKDLSVGNRLINARIETAADKPAFRRAFALRRCLLPADGYYEWWAATGPDGKQVKQPFFIHPRDGSILAMAGLYEFWRNAQPDSGEADAAEWVLSVAVLTTTAEDELGQIHDRMPLMVDRAGWDTWLDPDRRTPDEVREVLIPAAPGRLEAYPVSRAVNDVRNEGAHLLDPLPAEEVPRDLETLF